MIGPDSRYASCILYVDGATEFLGTRPRIDTSPRPDDVFHTVVEGDRIDLVAYNYLGSAQLWWVISDYNGIACPLDPLVGMVLRIPSIEHVEMHTLAG